MIELLKDLNQVAGVKGSMVVTQDGIVVNAALGRDLEEETVAAVSSTMIKSSRRALEQLGQERFARFVLTSSWGRMVFVDIDIAYLVVITSPGIKLDVILIEIDSAAYRIKHRRVD
jgi:predicted regulator of Ras-like GTPase activity (Roadblock/LC7/MglB family)